MAIYLKDLIADPGLLDKFRREDATCHTCGVVLQETLTGKRTGPEGEVCSDCYYEAIGELIEQHPIVSAGIRRG